MVTVLIFLSACQANKKYPYPMWEVYEGKEPGTKQGAVRIWTIWWPEGVYKYPPAHLVLKQADGTTWDVEIWDNDPKWWKAFRIGPDGKRESIPLERIYFQPREPAGPWNLYPESGGGSKDKTKK